MNRPVWSRHACPRRPTEHETTGHACWCNPRVEQVCPECGDHDAAALFCWRCESRGWVECPNPDTYDGAAGLLIIHNDPGGATP